MSQNAAHFLLQLTVDSYPRVLTANKYILHQKIKRERLRKPNVSQCAKCQETSHFSANFHLDFRCGRCDKKHAKGECELPAKYSDGSALYCVNCDKHGHAASWAGCSILKFNKDMKRKVKALRLKTKNEKLGNIALRFSGTQQHFSRFQAARCPRLL